MNDYPDVSNTYKNTEKSVHNLEPFLFEKYWIIDKLHITEG